MKNILDWIEENKQQFEGQDPRSMAQGPRNMYAGGRPGYSLGKKVLQNISKKKIPGITYYPPGSSNKTTENTISFLTRTTDKTGKRTSKTKTFF